jgi:hypothetical protein
MVSETLSRLAAAQTFLSTYAASGSIYQVEAAVLQMRKALESVAFAAIAPNQPEYEAFRANAEEPADYRKDYNARAILKYLEKINKDFYPNPILPPKRQEDGTWHFERRSDGYLTKKAFESFYDRLGKFLHADNPWGNGKGTQNLLADLPRVIEQVRALLQWHFTVIRTPKFNGLWVVEVPLDGKPCRILLGQAEGEFLVQ